VSFLPDGAVNFATTNCIWAFYALKMTTVVTKEGKKKRERERIKRRNSLRKILNLWFLPLQTLLHNPSSECGLTGSGTLKTPHTNLYGSTTLETINTYPLC
jgi:hypothetical protein